MTTAPAAATAVALAAATALVKVVVDDLYTELKQLGINAFGKSRATVKDATIARALLATTKVKTLWSLDKEISLYEFYYPAMIDVQDVTRKAVVGLKDFGERQHFVIQGTAGQGKSIFLRYLCGQELNPAYTSSRLPIFLELRRLRADLSLMDLVLQGLERYKLPNTLNFWQSLAASGRAVLLLDAFDEIDPDLVSRAVTDIEDMADLYRDSLQIIVTSRPESDIQRSERFRIIRLSPLRRADHSGFLTKICADREQAKSLLQVLRRSPADISELLTTPLMLTLLVILYTSIQTIPDTVPRFYEELFDVLFYRHDQNKPGFRRTRYTDLDDSSIKRLFSAFCFYVRLNNVGSLTADQLVGYCRQATEACRLQVDPKAFMNELVKTICLLTEEGFEYSFIHKSVSQYYAAAYVKASSDGFADRFFQLARRSRQWSLELRFLEQIDQYRYTKHYLLPVLDSIASQLGVSLNEPYTADHRRMAEAFLSEGTLAVEIPTPGNQLEILGWNTTFELEDSTRSKIGIAFMVPIVNHFDAGQHRAILEKVSGSSPGSITMVPFKNLDDVPSWVIASAADATAQQLRSMYSEAIRVLQVEQHKIDMLNQFAGP